MGNTYHAVKVHLNANLSMIESMRNEQLISEETEVLLIYSTQLQLQALKLFMQQNQF